MDENLNNFKIIQEIQNLGYPLKISNNSEDFLQNILSPSTTRLNLIEWLLQNIEIDNTNIYEKYKNILDEKEERVDIFLIIFKTFSISDKNYSDSEYKKAISGLSSESMNILTSLINFVKIYKSLYMENKPDLLNKEISDTLKIINYISEYKSTIFKENIRLFAPDIKLLPKTENKVNVNNKELEERIKNYANIILKVDKKLEKLEKLKLDYDYIEMEDLIELKNNLINFEKNLELFIKDYNQIYSQDIKYIGEDKISNLHIAVDKFSEKYNLIVNLSMSLEEIFALHNRILNL